MAKRGRKRRLLVLAVVCGFALIGVQRVSHWLDTQGLTATDFANELSRDQPRFEWKSIDKKHWQALGKQAQETTAQTDAREGTRRGCPAGMVHVKGLFRDEARGQSTGMIERLQDGACTDWISKEFPARCRVFDRQKIAQDIASVPTTALDFCVDRFEYPNVFGQYPMIVTTWREADAICKSEEKRLCTENEWTFACEGEEARPYPYGWTRDEAACVIDRPWRAFTEGALQPRDSEKARNELDTLWQGEPSGSRTLCRSSFGVYDLTGNVDEWTRSVNPTGYRSILKGGYWGPVRARCRPSTRAHNEDFIAYQQSFRCCSESGPEEEEDAGAPDASVEPDASAPAEIDGGTDDEVVAIARTRSRGCSTSAGGSDAGLFVALAIATATARAFRRTRRAART
ncbi:MAG: SUMF1/EgtB/PvdO family nonheme iron enzyme [Labilithrix sp.]